MVTQKQNAWKRKEVAVFTVGEKTLRCSGVGNIQLDMSNRHPVSMEVLVVDNKLLGFNLLLRFDAIKKLGGLCMTSDGTVGFLQLVRPLCAAITINAPNFHVEHDQNRRIWVVSWKWSSNQISCLLHSLLQFFGSIPIQARSYI